MSHHVQNTSRCYLPNLPNLVKQQIHKTKCTKVIWFPSYFLGLVPGAPQFLDCLGEKVHELQTYELPRRTASLYAVTGTSESYSFCLSTLLYISKTTPLFTCEWTDLNSPILNGVFCSITINWSLWIQTERVKWADFQWTIYDNNDICKILAKFCRKDKGKCGHLNYKMDIIPLTCSFFTPRKNPCVKLRSAYQPARALGGQTGSTNPPPVPGTSC